MSANETAKNGKDKRNAARNRLAKESHLSSLALQAIQSALRGCSVSLVLQGYPTNPRPLHASGKRPPPAAHLVGVGLRGLMRPASEAYGDGPICGGWLPW